MAEAGLPAQEFSGDLNVSSSRAAFARFAGLQDWLTTLFGAHDESALAFIASAHLRGAVVPRDASVLGFEDTRFAQSCTPAQTTICQPSAAMGPAGMRLLLTSSANEAPASVQLPLDLAIGDSIAPVRPARH